MNLMDIWNNCVRWIIDLLDDSNFEPEKTACEDDNADFENLKDMLREPLVDSIFNYYKKIQYCSDKPNGYPPENTFLYNLIMLNRSDFFQRPTTMTALQLKNSKPPLYALGNWNFLRERWLDDLEVGKRYTFLQRSVNGQPPMKISGEITEISNNQINLGTWQLTQQQTQSVLNDPRYQGNGGVPIAILVGQTEVNPLQFVSHEGMEEEAYNAGVLSISGLMAQPGRRNMRGGLPNRHTTTHDTHTSTPDILLKRKRKTHRKTRRKRKKTRKKNGHRRRKTLKKLKKM